MAIKIGSNFAFQGKQPNFERDRFATKDAMKAFPETSIDDGHLSYCAEDGNTYQFKSSNSADTATGKWRIFKDGFSTDTISTEPNQFVAGPINTRGNIGLRKIDVSDVPTLTNRVLIKGTQSVTLDKTGGIIKVATIQIPKKADITGIIDFNIQSRHVTYDININISYNTYFTLYTVIKGNHITDNNLYYYIDYNKTPVELVLYYMGIQYDTITTKVTNNSGTLKLSYQIDGVVVDALPEGAIKVNDVNYGNKNRFYATPKDAAGNPTFRAISINDLPDLSSKYATKAKITTINSSIADVRTSLESTQTDFVDLRNKVNAMPKTVFITQAAYDALTTKDANTIYYING